jgi:dienelactone hydrolase
MYQSKGVAADIIASNIFTGGEMAMTDSYTRAHCRKIISSFLGLLITSGFCCAEVVGVIPPSMNEQVVMIPVGTGFGSVELETTLFIPPGNGPHPLVVINHGKAFGNPRFDSRARFVAASREFLKRGYLVALPMRAGFSKSSGSDISPGCNSESYGLLQGDMVRNVLDQLIKRADVDSTKILVIGQSTGGLTSIASGSVVFPGVRGILNFAGGVKNNNCNWEQTLVDAFSAFGRSSKIPSLWFYGENDSFWGADLPKVMYKKFIEGGGTAQLVSYGKFADGDAHGMFSNEKGVPIWWPETEKFLINIGLPIAIKYVVEKTPTPPRTNFAEISDVQAIPILDERRKDAYKRFLALAYPRAFAIAPHGNVGWAWGVFDPIANALTACEGIAKEPCTLYAVDDAVVWPKGKAAP